MASALLPHLASALLTVLWVAAPAVLAATCAAVIAGLLQSVTHVQDATLSFVPRLVGVSVALLLAGQSMLQRMTEWTSGLWQHLG